MEQTTPLLPNTDVPKLEGKRFTSRVLLGSPQTPGTVRWFIKYGLTKRERTAGAILIAITIFNFLVSITLLVYASQ